jgi:crotonobetainyl-CoA:carnitine CoA-transferase CaiB-like acyl-CoA transferase
MTGQLPPASALAGVRVIDLTSVLFGPSSTQVLADYGADVIKVESPEGDSTRRNGPSPERGMASLFLGSNRNKRSIVLDLSTPADRATLMQLVETADVFVHNIRPQKLSGLGLDYSQLAARNKRLVYAGLHGFGLGGDYAGRPAYDDVVQSLGGAVDLARRQAGVPRYMPTLVADKIAGQMAAHAILAALFQRERTGVGQFVEVPMFECLVQFLLLEHMNARQFSRAGDTTPAQPDELGNRRTLAEWRKPYRTLDGYVCFMPYNDRDWQRFFAAAEREDLADDPRFATITERTQHIELLYQLIEDAMLTRTTADWLALGERLEIPCAGINALEDLESDPHLHAVAMFGTMSSGSDWEYRYVRSPVRLAASKVAPVRPPRLGEHTSEILTELGARVGRAIDIGK